MGSDLMGVFGAYGLGRPQAHHATTWRLSKLEKLLHSKHVDVDCCIGVSVEDDVTVRALVKSIPESFGDRDLASRAPLARTSGVDIQCQFASFFRFANQTMNEDAPCSIVNGSSKVTMDHVSDLKILEREDIEAFHQGLGLLSGKVEPLVFYFHIRLGNEKFGSFPRLRTPLSSGERPLTPSQSSRFIFSKPRVGNHGSVRESSKCIEPYVDAHGFSRVDSLDWSISKITDEVDEPALGLSFYSNIFDTFDGQGSIFAKFHRSELWQVYSGIFDLRDIAHQRERIVAILPFEPREARFLPRLTPTEERLVGLVKSIQSRAKYLNWGLCPLCVRLSKLRETFTLVIVKEPLAKPPVIVPTFLQGPVVEPAAMHAPIFQDGLLGFRWPQWVAEGSMHLLSYTTF